MVYVMNFGVMLFFGMLGVLGYFYIKETAKTKRINEAIRISHITGTEQQIRYLCERLETDEELLDQLLTGTNMVFGANNRLVTNEVADVTVNDNIGSVMIGGRRMEIMTYMKGNTKVVRFIEFGTRGGAKAPVELPLQALLRVLVEMKLIIEQ